MAKDTWRIVTQGRSGELIIQDFDKAEDIPTSHLQVGIDDCSTDLELRREEAGERRGIKRLIII